MKKNVLTLPVRTMKKDILVLGIGNLLLGDEGVGVQFVQELEETDEFDVLDGGTGGFHLLGQMESYSRVIIVDATMDDDPAGTVKVIEPVFASDYPPSLSAHDVGLKDLIGSLYMLGKVPKTYLIIVSIEGIQPMTMELSPPVRQSMPEISKQLKQILSEINRSVVKLP